MNGLRNIAVEVWVTLAFAAIAVGASHVSFKTHVEDIEIEFRSDIANITERFDKLEDRVNDIHTRLTRIETQMTDVRETTTIMEEQLLEVLRRLPLR